MITPNNTEWNAKGLNTLSLPQTYLLISAVFHNTMHTSLYTQVCSTLEVNTSHPPTHDP